MDMMRWAATLLWLGVLDAAGVEAPSLDIYSEFQRFDPFGQVIASDKAASQREILSPEVARNAHASFHIVVSAPPKTSYFLFIGVEPVNACRVSLYKEHFLRSGTGWIPDPLAEVRRLPDFGAMPDPDENIPGQYTRLYLLDLWIPPDSKPPGFRVEVQLKAGDWIVRPLEVRVAAARVPAMTAATAEARLPGVEQSADAAAVEVLRDYISGVQAVAEANPRTLRGVIRRNAAQDMALAHLLDRARVGPQAMAARWKELQGPAHGLGPERYLRIRDWVMAEAERMPW
jgi:hypothetical protein